MSGDPNVRHRLLPALERALVAVRDGSIAALSLDAFDTLLLRAVSTPSDAFAVLGHRLGRERLVEPFVTPALFAACRAEAELRARARRQQRGDFPEVTLDAIYDEIPDTMISASRRALIDAELALEAELVFADPDVAALARTARGHDVRVAVVSDTYLSGGQLTALLDAAGVGDLDAEVFTSSDHGTGKAVALFDVVVDSLGVAAGHVLHLGDHARSDVEAARAHGLHAELLQLRTDAFDGVIQRERGYALANPHDAVVVEPELGDGGMTAVRARLDATGPPPELPEHARPHWRVGASVFGPVFTAFADWVVDRAVARDVRRVGCFMREGTLLAPLLVAAADARHMMLEAVPLWLSRQVCARAAIEKADYAELRIFLERRVPPTLGELCTALGIASTDLGEVAAHVDTRLDDLTLRETAMGTIMGDEEVRARVVAGAAELRGRLVRLVEGVRHPEDDGLTVVDLGWHATTQRLLVRALGLAGYEVPVAGLYLLTTDRIVAGALEGVDAEGFLAQAGEPRSTTEQIAGSPEMLEQLCMGPEGSVSDLDESGRPLCGPTSVSERQLDEARATREGILAFGTQFRSMRPQLALGDTARLLRPVLARFVGTPTSAEVAAFGSWSHDDNLGTSTSRMLAHSELLHDGSYAELATLGELDAVWPAAIVARDASRSPSAGGADDDDSRPTIGLYVDSGAGFDEASAVHRPIHVNARGLSYAQLGVAAEGIRALRLDPVSCYALVRIDRIAVRFAVRDASDPVIRVFTTPDELRAWTLRDCTWLAGGLLVAQTTDPQMLLDVTDHVAGHVYAVLASVAFATLELPETAVGDDGEVELGTTHAGGVRALHELREVASEVRAATARRLASRRRPGLLDG